jgi:predicted amidohydrolase
VARVVTVAAAQTGPVTDTGEPAIIDAAIAMIDEARAQGVRLLVFPELFLAPFFANRLVERFDGFFLSADDAVLQRIRTHAAQARVALVLPFPERDPAGWFNTALVTGEDGALLGRYRKTHIPAYFPNDRPGGSGSYERFYFAPGQSLDTFEVCGMRIGIQICNDRLYPEASRVLALKGAELIVMPIAFSVYSDPAQRSSIWEVPLRARAYENGLFVLASNKVGLEGARQHLGRSMLVDPMGMIRREAGVRTPELLVVEIDLEEVVRARAGLAWWRDRRPDLYGPLVG